MGQFSPPPPQSAPTPELLAATRPYLRLAGTMAVGGQPTTFEGETVRVFGSGFCAGPGCSALALRIGNRVLAANVPVDAGGNFQTNFTVTEPPGGYTVTARQQGPMGEILMDAAPLIVPISEAEDVIGPPRLEFRTEGNGLVLAWPSAATGYVLEWTTTIADPNSWQPYSGQIVITNEENEVDVQPTGTQSFFRLRR